MVSNTATQTSGSLVSMTGTTPEESSDPFACLLVKGRTTLDSNEAVGRSLVIENTITQTGNVLARVDGTAGQLALRVKAGIMRLDGKLGVGKNPMGVEVDVNGGVQGTSVQLLS